MRLAGILLLLASSAWCELPEDNYLLIDEAGIEAARAKAARQPWAKQALESILRRAEEDLKREVALPPRGGQWPHWYSCTRDGATLRTESPTEHRCPVCGAVYRGEPYDSVVLYREHSNWSRAIQNLGLAYRFTGNSAFARKAREILAAYAGRYASYPRHDVNGADKVGGGRIMAQTLDESVWLIPVAFGYALVREELTPEERKHIEQDLLVAAASVIREHRMSIHNIQCWKNSAVALAGYAAGDDALVREAIDDPDRGFRAQIEKGVTDDGLWYEGSLGYHRYTMDALWPLTEAARLAGTDLYGDRYRALYDAPLKLALPDGNAPGFNDNSGGNVTQAGGLYELAFARWRRPEYGRVAARTDRRSLQALLYGAESLPDGPFIPTGSELLPAAGFAMLRSGGAAVAARFGRHGGGHGHPDKLGIVTYGAGRLFGLDPGSINYGVPLHREWYRSTIAHNTVSVDRRIQAPVDGRLLEWKTGPGETTLRAEAGSVYDGVMLRRTLVLKSDRLADRFECSSAAEHDYDWSFHAPGALRTSLELQPREGPADDANGYQHIRKVREGRTDGEWWAEWTQSGATLRIRFRAEPGTVVLTGEGPGRDPSGFVPLLIVRRHGTSTIFDCVHEFATEASK
jgi:hypothetical protein